MTDLYQFAGIGRTSQPFRAGMLTLAERLRTDPNYILAVMQTESGFDPSAHNPMGGATGLIQFMPATAKNLGTTVEALAKMTDAEQLKWVERFYQPHAGKIDSAGTAYMLTFLPAFAHKPDSFVLARKDDPTELGYGLSLAKVYSYNPGFDSDGSGEFTVGDVKKIAERNLANARLRGVLEIGPEPPKATSPCDASPCPVVARVGSRSALLRLRSLWRWLRGKAGA